MGRRESGYEFPKDIIREALKRAKYCCEHRGCNAQCQLEFHHRIPVGFAKRRNLAPEKIKSLDNILVLCPVHHREANQEQRIYKALLPQRAEEILGIRIAY